MDKRLGEIRKAPVPIFKKPRTALLAHPNNANSDNLVLPVAYSGRNPSNQSASCPAQRWNNSTNSAQNNQLSWQHQQQQQPRNQQSMSAPSWQRQNGPSRLQQHNPPQPQQNRPTQSHSGNSNWQQHQQSQFFNNQRPSNNAGWEQNPQLDFDLGGDMWQQHPAHQQGNQPQYGQPAPSMCGAGDNWQSGPNLQNYSGGNRRNGSFIANNLMPQKQQQLQNQGRSMQSQPNRQSHQPTERQNQQLEKRQNPQVQKRQTKPLGNSQGMNRPTPSGTSLKQTTLHHTFSNNNLNIAQGNQSRFDDQHSHTQQGNQSTSSPRYGQTPGVTNRQSFGQNMGNSGSQPWGMADMPNQQSFNSTDNLSSLSPRTQVQKTTQKDVPQLITSRPTADNTLKVLSATIQGMQHWSRYKDKTPMLFELIGHVDSAVVNEQKAGHKKEFMLKDDKSDSVRCVYFEIDREIPRLVRGQVYRCMGTYEPGQQRLRCVSVRPATDPERRLHRVGVASSDRAMRNWVLLNIES